MLFIPLRINVKLLRIGVNNLDLVSRIVAIKLTSSTVEDGSRVETSHSLRWGGGKDGRP